MTSVAPFKQHSARGTTLRGIPMRYSITALIFLGAAATAHAQGRPPIHLWFEPEWFDGVKGSFAYHSGNAKPTGAWGIAGPGIAAEWSQGGESEWNSIGAAAE